MSVSVVIPAYNAAPYLAETLESVLAQSLPPDEILLVDDGSTDQTAEIADRYAPRVKVFRRPNRRQATARNFGVDQATSEWIAFLDADDVWEPIKLERQMQQLAARPQADLCYTGTVFLMQQGDTAQLGKVLPTTPEDQVRQALLRHVTFMPSSVVVRRSVFLAVGGFDTTSRYGTEDHDLWLRLRAAKVVFTVCMEPLVRYRRHATNTVCDLPWLAECLHLFRTSIQPQLPRSTGWIRFNQYRSDHEADAAYTLRAQGNPRCLQYMGASLIHRPFHEPYRYKAFALMLYVQMRSIFGLGPRKS